jgi:cytochrome P450
MLTDPDLVHFDPPAQSPNNLSGLRAFRRNILSTIPRAVYEQPTTRIRLPFSDALFVCDPKLIEDVLATRVETFGRDAMMRRAFAPLLGKTSIFLSEGADWRWQRRAAAPIFRNEILLSFVPVFAAMAERQVARWARDAGDAPAEVGAAMLRTTFDVIVETMLGGSEKFDFDRYAQAMNVTLNAATWHYILAMFSAPEWMPYPGQRQAVRAHNYLHGEIDQIVAARAGEPASRRDLIALLTAARDPETGDGMTRDQVVTNILSFINAGHETTTVALTWTLWLLARDESLQQQLCDEVQAVAGQQSIAPEHVDRLACCRQTLQEAMRLYPPVPAMVRRVVSDTQLGEHRLKASTQIVIPIYALHRHEQLWENPNTFDLARFAPDQAKARSRYAYLPFSAGPRVCIGMSFAMMEAVVILATLVRAFRFRPPSGFRPKPVAQVSLRAEGGMPLFVAPR